MSRLVIPTNSEAQNVVEGLYKDLERRIIASPPGLCPVDLTAAFLKMCHAQTCGKCVPCRIGLAQLSNLLEDILNGKGTMKHLTMLEETARVIESTADCAIGYTAAQMVLKGLDGFKEDFMEHILHNRCRSNLDQPVPCVALCPVGVDIPGYIALTGEGRYADAVRLIRKDNPFPTGMYVVLPVVPTCIYTEPEIAAVGFTENDARLYNMKIKCGVAYMTENGKALLARNSRGFVRLIFEAYTNTLIGAQIMCARATDMIGEMATAIANGLTAYQLSTAMRAHPTYSEAITEAIKDALKNG